MIHPKLLLPALCLFAWGLARAESTDDGEEQMTQLVNPRTPPVQLKKGETVTTKNSFRPPVDISIVAKTDGPSLEIAYAADSVTFVSQQYPGKLIIHGGPGDGKNRPGMGALPLNRYVTIRWVVTPTKQSIFVDNDLRFEHEGDYSAINNPISVWSAHEAKATVKSIKVKKLPAETK